MIDRLSDRTDLYIKFGPGRLSAANRPRPVSGSAAGSVCPPASGPDDLKLCKRFGCGKKYYERDNHPGACSAHVKPPIFHETVKCVRAPRARALARALARGARARRRRRRRALTRPL